MDKRHKEISKNKLEEIVITSNSFTEVTINLGYDPKIGNIKKNIERLIKRNNISVEHFDNVKQKKESKNRYEKNKLIDLVSNFNTFKDILLELDLLAISSNYIQLKKYLKEYNIDYSHIKTVSGVQKDKNNEKYDRDRLLKLVNESSNLSDVLKKLNIRAAGGNFVTLKKWLNKYNIDTSHFFRDYSYLKSVNTKDLKNILVKESNFSRTSLKNKLYKEGVKQRVCELCGQNEEWRGKKMTLILDHINGIYNDNRIENLRIVCPNCNSTLDTHCGKNNSKKNIKKVEYGFNISDEINFQDIQTKEKIKSQYNRRIVARPEYEVLLKEIDELGYSSTGRKYGVSDNSIRKWVKYYEKYEITTGSVETQE